MSKYPCQFCSAEFPTRSSRKTHNKKCEKNTERSANQERTKKSLQIQRTKQRKRLMSPDDFAEIYDDLPDGAFFAMAEEMGIDPEDFCE